MSAKSNFKAAVVRAKRLYKTGRYKTFADAVKAAYKKRSVGAVKRKSTPKRKAVKRKKHHTHCGVVAKHERRVSGFSTKKPFTITALKKHYPREKMGWRERDILLHGAKTKVVYIQPGLYEVRSSKGAFQFTFKMQGHSDFSVVG